MGSKKILMHAAVNTKECVACGCCVKVCPKGIIKIKKGIYAVILEESCVGCGRCKAACPASVIRMEEVV